MTTKNNKERMLKNIKSEIELYIRKAEKRNTYAMEYVATDYEFFFQWYADEMFINTKRIEYFKAMLEVSDFENVEVLEDQISDRIINCEMEILNTSCLETQAGEMRTMANRLNIESKRSILKELRNLLNFATEERE